MINNKKGNKKFKTPSGIPVASVYTPRAPKDFDEKGALEEPGKYPFTRGIHPEMYRKRFWTMRQYAGYGSAQETNERFHYLLQEGQTGLSAAFDLPTQLGYDSDNTLAEGEVGRTGVAISCLEDMEELFQGIPLEKVSTSMTINATASILLAFYIALAKRRKVPLEVLSGTVQNDILKEFVARGNFIYPVGPSMRLVTDLIEYSIQTLPRWNPISISGYHIREKGSTAVQELAFTFSNAIAYVEGVLERGLAVDDFAPRLSFFFAAHIHFFEEIAKFRAARRIWARIMKEKFSSQNPRSQTLRFHTQTAGSVLTAQEPMNNITRVTLQALMGILGGSQSLHTNAYDEALALPTEESARVALRTQQIIALESGVAETVDPLGGSYFLESLTDEIEERVDHVLKEIEKRGGACRCLEGGYFHEEIERSAYEYQKEIESNERTIVGLDGLEEKIQLLKVDLTLQKSRSKALGRWRERRDKGKVKEALGRLREAAQGEENLMPHIIEAVEKDVTLGEISDIFREVFGEYRENR
ncbi:methylmalonyl-CoA mutase [candidate division TA06 bacterium]|nr:methylmalonyl-CoA mutase [candidate division TA06 bacterium]